MSLDNALSNATSGLRHTSRQISLTSHNVSNAGTEGYSRKRAAGEELTLGGVRTQETRRDIDVALRTEAQAARSQAGARDLRAAVLGRIAQIQGDPEDGRSLGGLIAELRESFTFMLAEPAESAVQNQALRVAEDVAGKLNTMSTALRDARQEAHDGLQVDINEANNLLRDIARQDRAVRAEFAAGRQGADVQDRRDAAIAKLATLMDVRAIPASVRGGITLVMGGGTILPLDERTDLLSIDNLTVSATTDAWSVPPPAAIRVGGRELPGMNPGGRMGERLELRDKTLVRMQSEVDLVAAALATRFEQQGVRLFTGSNPAVAPATPTIPAAIGFAAQIRVNPAVISNPALMRDGTPAMANTSGVDGFKDVLNNVLTYAFGAKRDAATDHPGLPGTGLGPSGQLASRFSPPRTIVEYAAAVSGAHTAEAAAAEQQADEMKTYRTHITSLVQRREGVDVDAEMAGMVQLQNAYAANARVMAAVQSMWDALLASVR